MLPAAFVVFAIALAVACLMLLGSPGSAFAADAPSSTDQLEIVITSTAANPSDPGSPSDSGSAPAAGYSILPRSGDPLSWVPTIALAAAAIIASSVAYRANRRPRGRHARNTGLFTVLAAFLAVGALSLPALAGAATDAHRVEFQADANGNVSQTKTVEVSNEATYYALLSQATIEPEDGWDVVRTGEEVGNGKVSISFAPSNASGKSIDAADALQSAPTDGSSDWTAPGTASKDGSLTLAVTVNAKGVASGEHKVAVMAYELTPQPYDGLKASISGAPEVGKPLEVQVSGLPDGDNTLFYQWQVSYDGETWTDVDGAVSSAFTPTVAHASQHVRVNVELVNPAWYGTAVADSAPEVDEPVHADPVQVVFDYNYGDDAPDAPAPEADAREFLKDGKVSEPAAPARAGFMFGGWYTKPACADADRFDFANGTAGSGITLYAKWTADNAVPYVVEHYLQDVDGEYPDDPFESETLYGTAYAVMSLSDMTPRTYTGFELDADQSDESVRVVPPAANDDEPATLALYYKRSAYTVKFNGNAGEDTSIANVPDAQQVLFDGHADDPSGLDTPVTPTRTDYDFVGWYKEAECENVWEFDVSTVQANTELFARWTPKTGIQYTVAHHREALEYEGDDGRFPDDLKETQTLYGTATQLTAATSQGYEGFTCIGSSADGSAGDAITQQTLSAGTATTVDVYYVRNTHQLSYDMHGVGTAPATGGAVKYGASVDASAPTADHYTFGGWFTDAGFTQPYTGSTMPDADLALHAKWVSDKYTVAFEQYGKGAATPTQVVEYNATAVKPADPSRAGYTFGGWFTDPADFPDDSKAFDFSTAITGNTTLYAKWSPIVSFDLNAKGIAGVTVAVDADTQPAPISVIEGGTLSAPDPAPTAVGYTLTGWARNADGTGLWVFDSSDPAYAVTGDMTLYAKWIANKYTVRFDGNGATQGAMADQALAYDQEAALSVNAYVRPGYDFAGWNAQSNGKGTAYADGQKVKNLTAEANAAITLFAQWTPRGDVEYTVEHLVQGIADNVPTGHYTVALSEPGSGKVATEVSATPYEGADMPAELKGFTFDSSNGDNILSAEIEGDGSTTLKLHYTRNADTPYKVEHYLQDVANDTWKLQETEQGDGFKGYTGATVAAEAKTYAGYTFDAAAEGTVESAEIAGDGSTTLRLHYRANTDTPYKVEHYQQNADLTGYDLVAADTQNLIGTTGATVSATPRTYEGFTRSTTEDHMAEAAGTVTAGDAGELTLKVYYDRAKYTVSFNADGKASVNPQEVYYDNQATAPEEPTAAGYTFGGWYTSAALTTLYSFETAVTRNITLYAKWTPNTDTAYTVGIYRQNADGSYEDEPFKTINATGTTDALTNIAGALATDAAQTAIGNELDRYTLNTAKSPNVAIAPTGDTAAKAYYDREKVTVTFLNTDGTQFSDQQVLWGACASAPSTNPTYQGSDDDVARMQFANWSADGAAAFDFATPISEDTTLVPLFSPSGYFVTFETWGLATISRQTVSPGGKATKPEDPSASGETPKFEGWYADDSFSAEFNFDTAINADTVVYAKWSPAVTFRFDGRASDVQVPVALQGSGAEANATVTLTTANGTTSVSVNSGEALQIAAPGYKITGWKKSDKTTDAGASLTITNGDPDIDLYAELTPNTYSVKFHANDGTETAADQLSIPYGTETALRENTFTRAGYTFQGWATSGDGVAAYADKANVKNLTTEDGGTVELFAVWKANANTAYTVHVMQQRLNDAGTAVDGTDKNASYVEAASFDATGTTDAQTDIQAALSARGVSYAGFQLNTSSEYLENKAINGDTANSKTEVYAYFDRVNYALSYDTGAYSDTEIASMQVPFGAKVVAPATPTINAAGEGRQFAGWHEAADLSDDPWVFWTESGVAEANAMPAQNLTLHAAFDLKKLSVKFYSSVEADEPTSAQTVEYGSLAAEPSEPEVATGNHFAGWFEKDGGGLAGDPFSFSTPVKSDLSLYAKTAANTYNVSFDANGATAGTAPDAIEGIEYGVDVEMPEAGDLERDGYVFLGWSDSASARTAKYEVGQKYQTLSESDGVTVKLFAVWKFNGYYVKFDANGGSGEMEDQLMSFGSTVQLKANEFEPADAARFNGWNTVADGSGKAYYNGQKVTDLVAQDAEDNEITLYAQWAPATSYTIHFNNNNGDDSDDDMPDQLAVNGKATTLYTNAYEKESETVDPLAFCVWNTDPDGLGRYVLDGESVTDLAANGSEVTLYAQWSHLAALSLTGENSLTSVADELSLIEATGKDNSGVDGSDMLARWQSYAAAGEIYVSEDTKTAYTSAREVDTYLIIRLIGVNHDTLATAGADGRTKAGMTFCAVGAVTDLEMGGYAAGGATSSWMTGANVTAVVSLDNKTAGNTAHRGLIYGKLPAVLKEAGVAKTVSKPVQNSNKTRTAANGSYRFWVLSPVEAGHSAGTLGTKYAYFNSLSSSALNNARARMLKGNSGISVSTQWLTREFSNNSNLHVFNATGASATVNLVGNNYRAVVPCFCL